MPAKPKKTLPRIQIICDTDLQYFRNIILGARHYAFSSGHIILGERWNLREIKNLKALVRANRIDGIIARANTRAEESRLLKLGIPVVNIANVIPDPRLPLVTQDDPAIGRLAAQHLAARNCSAYLCWGRQNGAFSQQRIDAFRQTLSKLAPSAPLFVFNSPPLRKQSGAALIENMKSRLQNLPRPLGIFTVLDAYAIHMRRALWQLHLRVPDDAALLGAGDDDFLVNLEDPPISSIKLSPRKIGYAAAAMIDRLLSLKIKTTPRHLLHTAEIITRKSTDIIHLNDPALTRALAFIRENRSQKIPIAAVIRASGLSRVPLQRRFRETLGRSIRQEIQRARIELAKELLHNGSSSIALIARHCNFPSPQRLAVVFQKQTTLTPTQYRHSLPPA